MKSFEEVLQRAKKEYSNAIRGKEYQDEQISENIDRPLVIDFLQKRKTIYVQNIALLEDVFGTELLQN